MSDNHEDPTGTHKPARGVARAMYQAFMNETLMAALRKFMSVGPPSPARVRHPRKVRAGMCNKFCPPASSGADFFGSRECERRRRQIAAGKLHPYVTTEPLRRAA